MTKRGKRVLRRPILLFLGTVLILAGAFIFLMYYFEDVSFGTIDESMLIRIPDDEVPADTLYITEDRRGYSRGAMSLIIPSIGVDTPVGESTLPEGLKEMPGLYEFSQLPGVGDVNVSIAGHRDIHDQVFLHANEISEGNYAYLVYDGLLYRYIYVGTRVVKPDRWDVIKPQGFSCLTLTTCDPVGTSISRLIVQFKLVDFEPFSNDYVFDSVDSDFVE